MVLEIAHGVRTIEIVKKLAPHLDAESEVTRLEKREADDQEGVAVMPGAAELLKAIPEGRWCVVTSGHSLSGNRSTEARQAAHSEGVGFSR